MGTRVNRYLNWDLAQAWDRHLDDLRYAYHLKDFMDIVVVTKEVSRGEHEGG
jgi:hypothetical protein